MQTENLSTLKLPTKSRQESTLKKSGFLNLPDLHFFQWCNQEYKLNKGVYNTIDNWFYEYGIVNILSRRVYLVAFLNFVKEAGVSPDQHKFIRFGNGGLMRKLHEFVQFYKLEVEEKREDF